MECVNFWFTIHREKSIDIVIASAIAELWRTESVFFFICLWWQRLLRGCNMIHVTKNHPHSNFYFVDEISAFLLLVQWRPLEIKEKKTQFNSFIRFIVRACDTIGFLLCSDTVRFKCTNLNACPASERVKTTLDHPIENSTITESVNWLESMNATHSWNNKKSKANKIE